MKLSEKRQQELYDAIADSVLGLRLRVQRHGVPDSCALDQALFRLEITIWRKVHKALNLEGPA